jgi:hypothetical protein
LQNCWGAIALGGSIHVTQRCLSFGLIDRDGKRRIKIALIRIYGKFGGSTTITICYSIFPGLLMLII